MGFEETNLGSNNLKTMRLLSGCCTNILTFFFFHSMKKFHYMHKLTPIVFLVWIVFHRIIVITTLVHILLTPKIWKSISISIEFNVKIVFLGVVHALASISIMCCFPKVPSTKSPISWRYGMTPRWIAQCSMRICSRTGQLFIFSNAINILIVRK